MTKALAAGRAKRLATSAVAVAVLVAGLAVWIRVRLTALVEEQVATSLQVTLDAAAEGVHQLLENARLAAQTSVDDPRAFTAAIACLGGSDCAAATAQLAPYMRAGGFTGLQLLDRGGHVIASEPAQRVLPVPNAALKAEIARFEPMQAGVVLPSPETSAKLHVAAVLRDSNAGRVGTVLFELPMNAINNVLRAARAGHSGETYAFDRQGHLLSESRFAVELARMGIVSPGVDGALDRITLRNPGRDLRIEPLAAGARDKQPPTLMVSRAISSGAGLELEPYRDYRGVLVVGAWTIVPDFGLGVATEVDARDVYGPLSDVQRLFTWLILALAIVTAALLAAISYAAFLHFRLTRPRLRVIDGERKPRKLNS
jgi:hypothetical protein